MDPVERTKLWLLFVAAKKNWNDAKTDCELLGGKLFSDLDGTASQLEFIVSKFGFTPMWLGVHRENAASEQWIEIDGKAVPDNKLVWGPNEKNPEPDLGDQLRVVLWSVNNELRYLHDDAGLHENSFLCDLK